METKKKLKNPHDAFFKHYFGHPEIASDFLEKNLSEELLAQIDLTTLRKRDKEFLPKKYRGYRYADLLYSVDRKDGKDLFFLLHLEAQSSPDELMAIRVLEYHTAIARAFLEKEDKGVPPILSFVFFHSNEEWKGPKTISDLFTDFDLYVRESLKKSFLVTLSPERVKIILKKYGLSSLPQIVLAQQPTKNMSPILGQAVPMLKEHRKCCKETVLGYMGTVDRREDEEFLAELLKFDEETANNYKFMFERAEQRGRQEGRQEGRQMGRDEAFDMLIERGIVTLEQIKDL